MLVSRNRIELVIFDCDGVLVDTEPVHAAINAEMIRQTGWEITTQEARERFAGRARDYMIEAIEQRLGRPVPDGWSKELDRRELEVFASDVRAIEGVFDAVDEIQSLYPTCIASSSDHRSIRHKLTEAGLFSQFESRIFSRHDVNRGKPAPDLFLHAAKAHGVQPERCVVVEDSQPGVVAARAANMWVLAYAWHRASVKQLQGLRTVIFHHMRELSGLIAGLDI
jgi:beta-phosphoglucomutase-like phosphatase (HAD superfamily)